MKEKKIVRIKEHIKKYSSIYVFIVFLLILSGMSFNLQFQPHDELWDFANIYKMNNGLIIYKDINVIITPLFFIIGNIIFKLFGANFFVFRMYGLIMNTLLLFIMYKIFTALKVNKKNAFLYCLLLVSYIRTLIFGGANYNTLAMFFYLLGIIINVKVEKDKKYLPYLQGIVAFVIFMIKQNIGIFYLIASFIMHLLLAKETKEAKKEITKFIKEVATFIILVGVFFIILYSQNILDDFLDLCFLGLKEFAIENLSTQAPYLIIIGISIFSIIYSIIIINIKNVDETLKKNNIIILPFTIMNLFTMYPIFNAYHIRQSILVAAIMLIYNMDITLVKELQINKKIYNYLTLFTLTFCLIYSLVNTTIYIKALNNCIEPYFGSNITEDQIQNIKTICNYIIKENQKGIDVKILAFEANEYMIVLGKNNKIMDLPFTGNLGYKGEKGLIEDLKNLQNVKVLISKEEKIIGQEPINAINYVKNNYNYEGEIENFLIYSK